MRGNLIKRLQGYNSKYTHMALNSNDNLPMKIFKPFGGTSIRDVLLHNLFF